MPIFSVKKNTRWKVWWQPLRRIVEEAACELFSWGEDGDGAQWRGSAAHQGRLRWHASGAPSSPWRPWCHLIPVSPSCCGCFYCPWTRLPPAWRFPTNPKVASARVHHGATAKIPCWLSLPLLPTKPSSYLFGKCDTCFFFLVFPKHAARRLSLSLLG